VRRHAKASTAGSSKTRRAALPIGAFAAILAALALVAALADAAVPAASTGSASEIQKTTATLNGEVNPEGALLEECKFEYGTSESYGQTHACNLTPAEIGSGTSPVAVRAEVSGLSEGTTYHFRLVAKNSEGTSNGFDQSFKTLGPPVVEAFATDVVYSEAILNAAINPEGAATTYKFQWGSTASYGNETAEANAGSDKAVHRFSHALFGLTEGTTYHYRVIATNANGTTQTPDRTFTTYAHEAQDTSCPNQLFRNGFSTTLPDCRAYEMVTPVDKAGQDVALPGHDSYIQATPAGDGITFNSEGSFAGQPTSLFANQYLARRSAEGWVTQGIDAPRPQGRSSDPFLGGRWFDTLLYKGFTTDLSSAWLMDQSRPTLTADAVQGPHVNLYRRDNVAGSYEALTTVAPTVEHGEEAGGYGMEFGGFAADGGAAVFSAEAAFTPDAAQNESRQVYESVGGELHLVSVLPSGFADPLEDLVGSAFNPTDNQRQTLFHAVSDDGSRVFWTGGWGSFQLGRVFLRENVSEPQSALAHGGALGSGDLSNGSNQVTGVVTSSGSFQIGQTLAAAGLPLGPTITAVGAGTLTLSAPANESRTGTPLEGYSECTEPQRACTVPVSNPNVKPGSPQGQYWTASADGSRAVFTDIRVFEAENPLGPLYEFNAKDGSRNLIASETIGVLGASEDLAYIYFVSPESLAAGATAGGRNLYLDHDGAISFVARLSGVDVAEPGIEGEQTVFGPKEDPASGYSLVLPSPDQRPARVSPDGRHIAFMSVSPELAEQAAGYDNTDANNGEPDDEVYVYEVGGGLTCVSCNPSGARPRGQMLQLWFNFDGKRYLGDINNKSARRWAAAWLPTMEHPLHGSHALSDDGTRVFFQSFEALVPADTNGVLDVYEWEAPGTGRCTQASASFSQQNRGCIDLISTGKSPDDSIFVDASADGRDAFFETPSGLLPQDPGLRDVYDAREGGGYPPPPASPIPCVGDSCQDVPQAPRAATPASAAFRGAGNLRPRRNCRLAARQAAALSRRAKLLRRKAAHLDAPAAKRLVRARALRLATRARRLGESGKRCRRVAGRAGR